MDTFVQTIMSFPTMIFTAFLVLVLIYWLGAAIGLLDIELLDFDLGDGDLDADNDLSGTSTLAGLLLRLGLQGVPVTIVLSLIALFGWLISYYSTLFLLDLLPSGLLRIAGGIVLIPLAIYLAALLTAVLIKPMRPFFLKAQQEPVKHIVGQVAIVRTSRVDREFGEAVLADGGAGLILKVRTTGNTTFSRGDRVVLLEHLKEENAYRVISEQEFTGN